MRAWRDDPRWQKAQAAYTDDYEGLDPDVAFLLRAKAAVDMNRIEHEYLDTQT